MTNKLFFILVTLLTNNILFGQNVAIHSHNDYRQRVPFYQAYSQMVSSIEADVYTTDVPNELKVAHDLEEVQDAPTFDDAYLLPLVNIYKQNNNRAWKGSDQQLVLLIDLKTPASTTLDILVKKLAKYPNVFDRGSNPNAVQVVISGNRPDASTFNSYPDWLLFDGSSTNYTSDQLKKIFMVSLNLRDFTRWNGKGSIVDQELSEVKNAIAKVHALGKPIRFWGTPDGITAWNTFHNLGIDYINTDRPEQCALFFKNFDNKHFFVAESTNTTNEIAKAERLDKTTAGFKGFKNSDLKLLRPVPCYKPLYTYSETGKIKNVIVLIGDGMGLSQIYAAKTVNGQLSILNINTIGLQSTDAEDAFTTDSAAAGSALATGEKHKNRHISSASTGAEHPSLTDVFYENGQKCGVVTLGNMADATPAAFYGHATERDNSDKITSYLTDSKLTLLAGSGFETLTKRNDQLDIVAQLQSKGYSIIRSVDEINQKSGKVICLDESMNEAAKEASIQLLARTTREAIKKLDNPKGFFLMIEGAKIDYAGHANSLPGSVMETLSFDLAVSEALRFADSNKETLIIVTGDHETGGLTLIDGNNRAGSITGLFVTDDHTPIMLPVFAYGPQSAKFSGTYPNTDIPKKILEIMKLKRNK